MVDESGAAFVPPEPPPAATPLSRPRHRGRTMLLTVLALVVAAGVGVGAWWAITQHNELNDTRATLQATEGQLETTQGELAGLQTRSAQQISELESESAGLQGRLTEANDQLSTLQTEHTQLVSDKADLETANTDLHAAIDSMTADIGTVREMTTALAVLSTPVNGYLADELPDGVLELVDELAALIGWYDTAQDYADNPSLIRLHILPILEDADDPAVAPAFEAYWDASGEQEEDIAFAEWMTRFFLCNLTRLDQALETGVAAVPD